MADATRAALRNSDICVLLALATVAVFFPVITYDFVNFDDPSYVTDNAFVKGGLSVEGLNAAFTRQHNAGYNPLAIVSHMADVQFFGMNAGAHHTVNVLIHIAGTLLLFLALHTLTRAAYSSAIVALLFAIHPLHVESVAWISSRKDVLSGFFMFLTLATYGRYARSSSPISYVAALSFYALGLLSKPTLVTLPFVLLLLDYWPLGRLKIRAHIRKVVVEKIPFFAVSFAMAAITALAQIQGGAVKTEDSIALSLRVGNAIVSYTIYLGKTLWPQGLAVFYPHPRDTLPASAVLICVSLLLVISVALLSLAKRRPYLIVGWLWFLGMLAPVSGIIQFGSHAMADRFSYLPLIGLFIAVVWLGTDLATRRESIRTGLRVLVSVTMLSLCVAAHGQVRHWRNSETLFRHALEVTQRNHFAHNNLAVAILQSDPDEAMEHFRQAIEIDPKHSNAHNNLGHLLQGRGELDKAIEHFRLAVDADPKSVQAWLNLGAARGNRGEYEAGADAFSAALNVERDNALAWAGLGRLLLEMGRLDEAVGALNMSLGLDSHNGDAFFTLGRALSNQEKFAEAVQAYRRALALAEERAPVLSNLGNALARAGRPAESIAHYEEAIQLEPSNVVTRLNMAAALFLMNEMDRAIKVAREVLEIDPTFEAAHQMLKSFRDGQK